MASAMDSRILWSISRRNGPGRRSTHSEAPTSCSISTRQIILLSCKVRVLGSEALILNTVGRGCRCLPTHPPPPFLLLHTPPHSSHLRAIGRTLLASAPRRTALTRHCRTEGFNISAAASHWMSPLPYPGPCLTQPGSLLLAWMTNWTRLHFRCFLRRP